MKRGITLITIILTVLIMAILVGVTTSFNLDTIKIAKKEQFIAEVISIQNCVERYYIDNGEYPIKGTIDVSINNMSSFEKDQFVGETITNNNITLNYLDIQRLGIKKTIFGNNDTSMDVYLLSNKTGRLYYLKGFEVDGKKHYALNEELYSNYTNNAVDPSKKNIMINDVTFSVSSIEDTNKPVTMTVILPSEATAINVTTTNSIKVSEQKKESDNIYIEINSDNVINNYDVTVSYTLDGVNKTAAYNVKNVDNIGPNIYIEEEKHEGHIKLKINVEDDVSGVKKIKYEEAYISDKTYFEKYGSTLQTPSIDCYKNGIYTIYAIDNLGNETIETYTVIIE